MKEKNKTLKIILAIVVVVLISLISFGGVFTKDNFKMKNLLPEYKVGMDFNGKRVFSIKPDETVDTEYYDKEGNKVESSSIEEGKEEEYDKKEIPVNSEDILTKENFDKTKNIIEKRLELLGVSEYEVRENSENGEIYISIPENKDTDEIISQIIATGDFKITDSEDEENVLIPGEQVKEAKAAIGIQNGTRIVFLNIQFDKEGTKKLYEISKEYKEGATTESSLTDSDENDETEEANNDENNQTEENSENSETETDENNSSEESSEKSKKINLVLDGTTLLTTNFEEEIKNGLIQLSMGNSNSTTSSTSEELQEKAKQASNLAMLMETEKLPIKYTDDTNLFIQSEFDNQVIQNFIIIACIILGVAVIYAIIKYKKEGIFLMISQIGFIASLLIAIRYTNVVLSITGILAIIISSVMSYIFLLKILKRRKTDEKAVHKIVYESLTIYVPALIISVVFSFVKYLPIASFGMVMFYSIMLMIIYHGIITKNLIINSENK